MKHLRQDGSKDDDDVDEDGMVSGRGRDDEADKEEYDIGVAVLLPVPELNVELRVEGAAQKVDGELEGEEGRVEVLAQDLGLVDRDEV